MREDVRVSVIIPVYNHGRYIGQAIESVLDQSMAVFQVIVVDDGSKDDSARVAKSFAPVNLIESEHRGIGHARNLGVAAAIGSHVAFLDADDYWDREKTAIQTGIFAKEPSIDMVFGQVRQFLDRASPEAGADGFDEVFAGIAPGAMMVRREAMTRVGAFSDIRREDQLDTAGVDPVHRADPANARADEHGRRLPRSLPAYLSGVNPIEL